MPESFHLKLQTALGAGYRLDRELGGGGMSRVFLADERRFGRRVVIKVLTPELTAGLSVERFEREVMLAAALQEPHIVPVLTAGDADGMPYYTMRSSTDCRCLPCWVLWQATRSPPRCQSSAVLKP